MLVFLSTLKLSLFVGGGGGGRRRRSTHPNIPYEDLFGNLFFCLQIVDIVVRSPAAWIRSGRSYLHVQKSIRHARTCTREIYHPNIQRPLCFFPVVRGSWGVSSRMGKSSASALGVAGKPTPAERLRLYRTRMKQDPEKYRMYLLKAAVRQKKRREKIVNLKASFSTSQP